MSLRVLCASCAGLAATWPSAVRWHTLGRMVLHGRSCWRSPMVVPHGAAGGTLAALQLRWSELGLHPMKLARVVRVMVLCLSVDMTSSNIKLLGFLIRVLLKNILILPLYCMLHQVHRIVAGFDKHMPVASEAYSLSKIIAIDDYCWAAAP